MFPETLTYLEPKLVLLIIFYNGSFSNIKILIVFNFNICTYTIYNVAIKSSPHYKHS
jgi:hypothetical protein